MKWFAILPLCVGLGACEKVVELELPEGRTQLVIEARLERVRGAVTGAQRIKLSITDAYFSNREQPPARGATVRIIDDVGGIVTFSELSTDAGVYVTTSLVGEINRSYTLQIDYQGERYQASERLLAVAPIDSLYFSDRTSQFGPKEGVRATIDFVDPASVKNYYLWDQYVNGQRIIAADSTFKTRVVAQDDGLDGRRVSEFQPYEGIPVPRGADVLMRQMALSESNFRYFRALSDQTSNDGSPFAVPLASVRSNIVNVTNRANRPLGYFMASEIAEARARVP